jgi:glycosyltransferase involved in cell wall biosynthesis
MKIFIISCVFPPEPLASAFTSADLAEEMVRRGHEVIVFAPFPNRPSGYLMDGYVRKWKQIEYKDGYKLVHSWHTLSKKSLFFSRTAENISFGLTSTWQILREKPPDVAYINTWPLFSQYMNSRLLKRHRVPVVSSVQDIYPEILIGKGLLKANSWISRVIRQANLYYLQHCTMVTSISPGMVKLLIEDRGLPPERIQFIRNWLDASVFCPDQPKNGVFRQKFGISSEVFLAMFAGSLTMAAGVDLYVKVADKLSSRNDIRILLIGDGSVREKLEKDITSMKLKNIQVVYPLHSAQVPEVQAAADVLLLSLSGEIAQSAAPSKLIAYMLSGRPVGLGSNARKYAEANFSKQVLLTRLADLLESATKH